MTISRKRTAGAALAGSALVAAAVFTPVAAYAAPEVPETPADVQPAAAATVVAVPESISQSQIEAEGIAYQGEGFTPGQTYEITLRAPGGETIGVENQDGSNVVGEDGTVSGIVDPQGAEVATGEYALIITEVSEIAITAETVFTVTSGDGAETPAPVEQTLTVEPTDSTLGGSVEGFSFAGTGFAPEAEYSVELQLPGSEEWVPVPDMSDEQNAFITDAEGNLAGTVNYFNQDTGEATEFPGEGDYQLRVTQEVDGEVLTAVSSFTIAATEDDDTETPTPTEEETTQTLGVEQETYTPAETVEGVEYFGEGFAPSTAFQLWVIMPGETEWTEVTDTPAGESNEQVSNGEGQVYGALTYYNLETGDPIEFPEGAYQVRVTQEVDGETLSAEASFTVAEATTEPTETADPTETAAPTEDESNNNGNKGDELAQTGADDTLPVFLAGGLVLMTAGAGLFVVRRRMEA